MTTLTTQYGLSTQDTPRNKREQKTQGCEECLQCEARADTRSIGRKKDRIIYVENSSNITEPFVIQEVGTAEELRNKICEKHPGICIDMIGMRISHSRLGVVGRKFYEEDLPSDQILYVYLYLKKHTPSYGK